MAFERIGIGATLSVNEGQYIDGMGRARDANGRFVKSAKAVHGPVGRIGYVIGRLAAKVKASAAKIGAGFRKIGGGLTSMAMGALPMTLMLGAGVKKAVDFEKQMSNVGAVTLANAENMARLTNEAQRLGIVSTFSATQVGEAQEFLGRAGANTEQIIASLSGVTNAAAADDMELAEAADIVSTAVKGMGLEWSDATHVANVFAAASANSKTDISSLGEAFKMAMPTAKLFGMSIEDLTTVLGKLHDSGLKGTMAGTTFTNMMTKIAKPSAKARILLKKYKVELVDASGKLRSMGAIAGEFSKKIDESGNVVDKVAIASELFGLRGIKAFNALAAAGEKGFSELQETLEGSSEAFGGLGVAGEMARRRLDNVNGAVKLLMSSLESFSIGLYENLLGPMKGAFQGITKGLNAVMFMMKALNKDATFEEKMEWYKKAVGEVGIEGARSAEQVAKGVKDAISAMSKAWDSITNKIKEFSKKFGESFDLQKVTKWVVLIGIAAGAIAPLLLGMLALKFVVGGLIAVFSGFGAVMLAAFWPVVIILGIIAIAFSFLRKENESFGETARRVWGNIKTWVTDLWDNAILPFIDGIRSFWIPVIEDLSEAWNSTVSQIKDLFGGLFESFNSGSDTIMVNWKLVGQIFVTVFSSILKIAMYVIRNVIVLFKMLLFPIRIVLQFVHNIAAAFGTMFGGKVLEGFKRLGLAIVDFIIAPIRALVKWIIELAGLLGASDYIPKGLSTFAEKGITGLVYPEEKPKVKPKKSKTKAKIATPKSEFEKNRFGAMPSEGELLDLGLGTQQEISDAQAAKEIANISARNKTEKTLIEAEAVKNAVKEGVKEGQKDQCLEANVTSNLSVDGDVLNKSSARSKSRLKERSGGKMTPWQHRQILESGSIGV